MVDEKKLKAEIEKFKLSIASKYNVELSIFSRAINSKTIRPTLNQIKNSCLDAMREVYPESINIKDFKSNTRAKFYPMVRQVYGYFGWKYNYTYAAIGDLIKKDHSTIIYSKKKVEDMLSIKDKKYTEIFNIAENLINEKYVGNIPENVE